MTVLSPILQGPRDDSYYPGKNESKQKQTDFTPTGFILSVQATIPQVHLNYLCVTLAGSLLNCSFPTTYF